MDPVVQSVAPRLDALAARFLLEKRLPGLAVGVVRDGALAWSTALGFADRATARRVTTDTPFRVASITKSFTATAVLQLRDERRLRLDDPLVTYVPEARSIADPFGPIEDVTIRRLLTHSSGLQGDVSPKDPWEWRLVADDELLADLDRVAVMAAPDTDWRYSNLGYALLGIAVGRVVDEPFEAYVQRCIIDVAGLRSTSYFPSGDLAARSATGYGPRRYDDDVAVSRGFDSSMLYADGGLWSTVEDLARWLVVQSRTGDHDRRGDGDRVLDGGTLREMQHATVIANADWTYGQGLGWGSTRIGEDVWVGHTGSLDGFRAIVLFRPSDRLGVIALANGSVRPTLAKEIATIVLEAHRAAAPTLPDQPPAPTPAAWRELVGFYREDNYGLALQIEVLDGALALIDADDPSDQSKLAPTEDPLLFTFAEGELIGERCQFLRNAAGVIAGVNVAGAPLRRLVPVER
ncbi:MAG: serine hydrolase domain-containing protein [Chloroflexota bacterium]